jgi:rod shape determining protein RodA
MVISGWINIYSAVYNEEHQSIFDMSQRYGKQILWILLSFVLATFLVVLDSKFYVTFSNMIYAFFILLLITVLFFGREVNASKSWLVIGSFALQPAEFAKLGTSLAIAKLLSAYNFNFNSLKKQLNMIAIIALPVLLIFLQNDTGSALVYAIFIIPLFREGMSGLVLFFALLTGILFVTSLIYQPIVILLSLILLSFAVVLFLRRKWSEILKIFALLVLSTTVVWLVKLTFKLNVQDHYNTLLISSVLTGVTTVVYALFKRIAHVPLVVIVFICSVLFTFSVEYVFEKVLAPHQRARIENLLGVESDPLGAGYNVNQSKIAIGSGGFSGKGFLQGTQTKFDFVPEQSTDFIFCTVGEEWGFIGSAVIVLAFLFLLIRLVILAERQRSVYSRVFGYCVASIIFFHFTVNIGMTIGLAPVIGIPLPFFSYGGSSLWFFTMLLFIFLRLDASRLEQLH